MHDGSTRRPRSTPSHANESEPAVLPGCALDVQGGQTYRLTKGDVITVPANTPHWFKEVPTKSVAYYAINTEP